MYLWRENLLRGLQERASASSFALSHLSDMEFEQHATMLQDKFLLLCWRKRVLRLFLAYCRQEHSELQGGSGSLLLLDKRKQQYMWAAFGKQAYQDQWSQKRSHHEADMLGGINCLQLVADATWWDWKGGSRPFFWRWAKDCLGDQKYVAELQDGMHVLYDEDALPKYPKAQSPPRNDNDREKVSAKLLKFMNRRHIVYS